MVKIEVSSKEEIISGLHSTIRGKEKEVEEANRKILKLKDERMDYKASVDQIYDKERTFREELTALRE